MIYNDWDGDYIPSPVTLLHNNFDQTPGTGFYITLPITIDPSNLDKVDPLFVDAENGDLRLLPGSPMIDAGYPGTPDLPEFDIAGTPRVLGESVDIGAYEFDDGSDPRGILFIRSDGTGSGTVISDPEGIDCGADCAHAFVLDTPVTLTGTPDATSVFDGWSGDADCADGQLTMDGNRSCTATFNAVRQLTASKAGEGDGTITSTPSGIDCGSACRAFFYLDESVALTATPDAQSLFTGWSGDPMCPNPVLDQDRACTATFDPILYRLLVTVVGQGSVTSNPAGIACGSDCSEDFTSGTVVTLVATPSAGARFGGWSGDADCADGQVTLDAARQCTATFNTPIENTQINAAILPYARAVAIGETATAFASVINSGNLTATGCSIALPVEIPATFGYQTTNAANALIGNSNTPVDIAPGATQGFVFGITPSQAMAATEIPLVFDCANTAPAASYPGLNTFILSAAATAPPDLLAIGATPSGDGVVRLPSRDGAGFFATAAVNIGSAGSITVSADDGGRGLPLSLQVCETTQAGEWIVCGNTLTRSVGAGQTAYYSVFVTGTGQPIAFDPANNRLFLRFAANGTTVGATNVAVTAP